MRRRLFGTVRGLTVAVLALAGCVAGAHAQTLASLPAEAGVAVLAEARPIAAWVTFCQNYPGECGGGPLRADAHCADARGLDHHRLGQPPGEQGRPADDRHGPLARGRPLGPRRDGIGDCEDFQLLKRHLLAEAGLPKRAMRMTVVIDEKGEGHAVLTLITDRGDLVLDNKTSTILPWHRTGYTFIKRESQDATAWVSLGGVTSPTTTANR